MQRVTDYQAIVTGHARPTSLLQRAASAPKPEAAAAAVGGTDVGASGGREGAGGGAGSVIKGQERERSSMVERSSMINRSANAPAARGSVKLGSSNDGGSNAGASMASVDGSAKVLTQRPSATRAAMQ